MKFDQLKIGKSYKTTYEYYYGFLEDQPEELKNKALKLGWVNDEQEVVIPAGSEFVLITKSGPSGWPIFKFKELGLELDIVNDEDENNEEFELA